MGATCLKLEELHAEGLADAVRLQLPSADNPALSPQEIQDLLQQIKLP
jgi:hypothetical protein